MSLGEEIEIYRFGQGVYPVAALLARFAPLEGFEKRLQLLDLHDLIQRQKPEDVDLGQVITDSGIDPEDPACALLNTHRFMAGTIHIQEGDHDQVYRLLLYVFRQAYQRQWTLKKGTSTKWQYADLSGNDTAQALLTEQEALIEAVYTDASFRNEFTSLATIWRRGHTWGHSKRQKPAPEEYTRFDFISYDDLVTEQVSYQTDKYVRAVSLLKQSMSRGLAVRYNLTRDEASRLLYDVLERHFAETPDTNRLGQ